MTEASSVDRLAIPNIPDHGRVQRGIPTAFTRPSITIGEGRPPTHREWRTVVAGDVRIDDEVPGVGRVTIVNEEVRSPAHGSGLPAEEIVEQHTWTVTLTGAGGNVRVYPGNERVWIYTDRT